MDDLPRDLTAALNRALRAAGLPHNAVYVPAEDETVDDDIELQIVGQPTRFSVQLGGGFAVLNEHGFENGELAWAKQRAYIAAHRHAHICRAVVNILKGE